MSHEGSAAFWRVLGLLEKVKKSGTGYEAACPAHEDRHASLSIGIGYDGRVLLDCKAGCQTIEVLRALNLEWNDLFEKSPAGNPVRRFRLLDTRGQLVAEHVREDLAPNEKVIRWESRGKNGLNGTRTEDLPLYRAPDLQVHPEGPVIVTEGEKAAEALASIGVLAVGTVTGADGTPGLPVLAPLQGREVWLWPDNDDVGRSHMLRIAQRIKPSPKWITWPNAPIKGDAADYVTGGGTADGVPKLVAREVIVSDGPRIWRGDELAVARFDAVRWAIPGILPSGLSILAGRPKLGKSWLVLGWVLDVARGVHVLKKIEVEQGDALYLALEDSPRRMQERQAMMLGDARSTHAVHIVTEWPRQNEGGLELIEQWLDQNQRARLVVIDTFKRFRPKEQKSLRLYDLDYDAIAPVAALALRRNVAIVLVFHTNKLDPVDPIDLVSGTLGLSGAADGVLVLKRERGQADASLFVTGRDVEEQDLALKWEKEDTLGWTLLGQAEDFRRSKERQEILNAVSTVPGMKPSEIAAAIGRTPGSVRFLLFRMVNEEDVRVRDGKYFPTTPLTPLTLTTLTNANGVSPNSTISPNSPVSAVSANGTRLTCRVCGNELPLELARIGLHYDCVEDLRGKQL